jgi:DNA-binding CsgD family transcriptional regulator
MGGRRLAALQDCDDPDGCPPVMVRDPRTGESFAVASRCLFPQFQSGGLVMGRERIVTVTSVASTDEPDLVAIGAFCREHDLSPREAEVTTVVLTGGALSRHAIERGVSVDTVRKQLKAAMARLEVANQKAMVLLFERFRSAG